MARWGWEASAAAFCGDVQLKETHLSRHFRSDVLLWEVDSGLLLQELLHVLTSCTPAITGTSWTNAFDVTALK